MLRFAVFIPLLIIFSCSSTNRTKYQPFEENYGYRSLDPEGDLRVVNFRANPYTEKKDAVLFAEFRAIEKCHESGLPLAHILDVQDKTQKKDVIRSSATGFPSYYYGMSPFYNRFHSGIGIGYSTMSSNTWEETYAYPEFTVKYECVEEAVGPELVLREVSKEDMKLLVKDLKGGLQVEEIMKDSPNVGVIESGDVIIRVNGQRVERISQVMSRFKPQVKELPVVIMREGIRKNVVMKATNVTDHVKRTQTEIIRSACQKEEIKDNSLCKTK